MQELVNLGISNQTLKSMVEINPELPEISNDKVKEIEEILSHIKCSPNMIINIISSNSLILSRTKQEVVELINYLYNKRFHTLNILFDSNPYILNLDIFEIENYINKRVEEGETIEDVIDDLDSNPYLFNEL